MMGRRIGAARLRALAHVIAIASSIAKATATAFWLSLAVPGVQAQTIGERLAADLREEIHRVPVTVRDLYSRQESGSITVTVFRPAGDGPFPAVLFSHGRALGELRASQGRQRFEVQARWLVSMGYVVLVPTRLGYGDTYGAFDPEDSGPCPSKRYEPMAVAAADQLQAVLAHAATLPYVDRQRWVAMGQSVGGLSTLSLASRRPAGLLGAVNLAGGSGGDPKDRPDNSCGPEQLETLWRTQAQASGGLPTLWLYWVHDRYWGRDWPARWAKAWQAGGGKADFHHLEPWGSEPADGHSGLGQDMNRWVPLAEAFLRSLGLPHGGVPARPPASGFAPLADTARLPVAGANASASTASNTETLYRNFLAARKPRAFAIGPNGAVGWASGDWAIGRALGNCQWRRGAACRLYAVDDDVVWVP